jgi:hypothetical protein
MVFDIGGVRIPLIGLSVIEAHTTRLNTASNGH